MSSLNKLKKISMYEHNLMASARMY